METILIDPGHGATQDSDDFRVGPSGEREEWINLRVSLLLRPLLEQAGYRVVMTRERDEFVSLEDRARKAIEEKASLMVSVHHNSAHPVNPSTDYPIVFVRGHATASNASNQLAQKLMQEFVKERGIGGTIVSDCMIYENGFSILRDLDGKVPTVIGEYSFFSSPKEETRLKDEAYCQREAECYLRAIQSFLAGPQLTLEASKEKFFDESYRKLISESGKDLAEIEWEGFYQSAESYFEQKDWERAKADYWKSLSRLINHELSVKIFQQLSVCHDNLGQSEMASIAKEIAAKGLQNVACR